MIRTALTAVAIAMSAFTSVSAKPAGISPTSLINGKKPPGTVAGLVNTKLLIDAIRPDGMQLSVTRGTRLPGTRVAIHVHEAGLCLDYDIVG